LALVIDTRAPPTSKSNTEKRKQFVCHYSAYGKDATVCWKLVVWFEALLRTRHVANRFHILVCSEILSCPLCFDYGVYSEMMNNLRIIKTMHFQYVAAIPAPPLRIFTPPSLRTQDLKRVIYMQVGDNISDIKYKTDYLENVGLCWCLPNERRFEHARKVADLFSNVSRKAFFNSKRSFRVDLLSLFKHELSCTRISAVITVTSIIFRCRCHGFLEVAMVYRPLCGRTFSKIRWCLIPLMLRPLVNYNLWLNLFVTKHFLCVIRTNTKKKQRKWKESTTSPLTLPSSKDWGRSRPTSAMYVVCARDVT